MTPINNGNVPRDHWLEPWEHKEILDYHDKHPLEGYRRLTFMMLDDDVVAVSPCSVYRVLCAAGRLDRCNANPSRKGTGFVQPLAAPEVLSDGQRGQGQQGGRGMSRNVPLISEESARYLAKVVNRAAESFDVSALSTEGRSANTGPKVPSVILSQRANPQCSGLTNCQSGLFPATAAQWIWVLIKA